MVAIEIELLTGRYAATSHSDRRRVEWPPHPARFFSALVAALHDREPVDPVEREALLWLECQPPPTLDVEVDADHQVGRRDVHDVFVPVNDVSVAGKAAELTRALHDAEGKLAEAEREPNLEARTAAVKLARKEVAAVEKKLAAVHAGLTTRDEKPSKVDVEAASALTPNHRTRQVRTFPVASPARSTFTIIWPAFPDRHICDALDALCGRVKRLGHSSSLVRCALVKSYRTPTLVPSAGGDHLLRVVGEGQLDRLEREFERHRAVESRVLPARPQRYATVRESEREQNAAVGVFSDEWIIYQRCAGARLRSSRGTDLARALRAALLEANGSDRALSEALSGHRGAGPANAPHIAFVACPHVGYPHADGGVMGCAIVLPRDLAVADRHELMRLIARWEGGRGKDGIMEIGGEGFPPVELKRVDLSEKKALQSWRWCRVSRRFITATPIALDRHPGNLRSNQSRVAHKAAIKAQLCIADACDHIGLPRPVEVEISMAPFLEGAQAVREFSPWPAKPGGHRRARVHARIDFDRDVRGPLLLGAGRYFGLGLCLPVPHDRGEA